MRLSRACVICVAPDNTRYDGVDSGSDSAAHDDGCCHITAISHHGLRGARFAENKQPLRRWGRAEPFLNPTGHSRVDDDTADGFAIKFMTFLGFREYRIRRFCFIAEHPRPGRRRSSPHKAVGNPAVSFPVLLDDASLIVE